MRHHTLVFLIILMLHGCADERLGSVVAVTLGGVDQIDAELAGAIEHRIDVGLGEVFSPFAAELPGANSDDGDDEVGFSESAVLHEAISAG